MNKAIAIYIVPEDYISTRIEEVVGVSRERAEEIFADIEARFETGDEQDKILWQILNSYEDSELVFACICFGYMQYHNLQLAKMMGLA